MKPSEKPLEFASRAEWRAWLETHHATEPEAWLLVCKKRTAGSGLTLEAANEEAVCFGWVDSVLKPVDQEKFALRYSPRRAKSIWSESNKRRAAKLIREGRMTDAGLAAIRRAKASGEWEAATAREDVSTIPPDLARELRKDKTAQASFQHWPPSRKKQYLYWLSSAKRAETRQKRIQAIVRLAATRESR